MYSIYIIPCVQAALARKEALRFAQFRRQARRNSEAPLSRYRGLGLSTIYTAGLTRSASRTAKGFVIAGQQTIGTVRANGKLPAIGNFEGATRRRLRQASLGANSMD